MSAQNSSFRFGADTYALGIEDSTSAGTPESWAQGPRAAPGWPSFSGGYVESSQSMLA